MQFLSIPFRYSSANTRPNDMLAGMPSISAVAGMAHNVQRLMQEKCGLKSFTTLAFSLVYFSIDRDIAPPRRPPEAGEAKGEVMILPGLMDIRKAHGEASLIVHFSIEDAADHSKLTEVMQKRQGMSDVEHALMTSLRFAGGDIFLGVPGEFGNSPMGIEIYQAWGYVLGRMLRSYPTQAFLIEDQSQLIREKCSADGLDSLTALTELLFESKKQARSPQNAKLSSSTQLDEQAIEGHGVDPDLTTRLLGTLLPAAVGFHEICEPRGEQVFVESVISIVRAKRLSSVRLDLTQGLEAWQSHFWKWEHLPASRLYRATSFLNKV